MTERATTPGDEPGAALHLERRAFVRMASDLAVTCRAADRLRDAGWPGKLRDISQGGVGLLLRHRFRPGTVLDAELQDGTGKSLRTVRVKVVHTTAVLVEGVSCWLLGCALEQPLSDEEFRALS